MLQETNKFTMTTIVPSDKIGQRSVVEVLSVHPVNILGVETGFVYTGV